MKDINPFPILKKIQYPDFNNDLFQSIEENGIIHPVYVFKKNKKFFILDGYKRFCVAKKLKLEEIPTIICYYHSEKLIFLKYFKINLYRKFNEIEISNLIFLSNEYFNDQILTKFIFLKLNKKYSKKNLTNYLSLQNLIDDAKKMLINGKLNFLTAINLSKIKAEEQQIFINLTNSLKLNSNKQKKCFELLKDLASRNEITLNELIEKNFKKFLFNEYSIENEKKFFEKLIKLHSPDYYTYIKKFQNYKKEILKNTKGINIISPDNFESNILKIEIFFKNEEEMKNKLNLLKKFKLPSL